MPIRHRSQRSMGHPQSLVLVMKKKEEISREVQEHATPPPPPHPPSPTPLPYHPLPPPFHRSIILIFIEMKVCLLMLFHGKYHFREFRFSFLRESSFLQRIPGSASMTPRLTLGWGLYTNPPEIAIHSAVACSEVKDGGLLVSWQLMESVLVWVVSSSLAVGSSDQQTSHPQQVLRIPFPSFSSYFFNKQHSSPSPPPPHPTHTDTHTNNLHGGHGCSNCAGKTLPLLSSRNLALTLWG